MKEEINKLKELKIYDLSNFSKNSLKYYENLGKIVLSKSKNIEPEIIEIINEIDYQLKSRGINGII